MSLIEAVMVECVIMNKSKVSDGEGGHTVQWTEGDSINVAITLDTTMQAKIAESQGVTSTYTLTTKKENVLEFHEVIKRKSDGATFRVTTDGKDKKSPTVSTLDMTQVSAEKWSLT